MRLEDDAVIEAAIDAGIEWLDTAHAYEVNETRIARVLATRTARVITKVGMTRPGGAWVADGRAKTVLEQARESRARLGRVPDLMLLHAPDPNVALATSMRALVKARDEGLALAIGLSNPSRRDLDELAVPITAIEVALGPKHDAAARAGMLAWCKERGVRVFAHSPLGGVAHASKLSKDTVLSAIAKRLGATAAEVMLAYLAALGAIPIPGARRIESVASLVRASSLVLAEEELALLDARFPGLATARSRLRPPADPTAEVVLVMGLAGAGKSTLMARFPEHERLNRDLLGGTLAGVAKKLEATLARGATRVVLDNTYLSRASRSDVVRVAHRAGAAVKCIHVEISLADARINVANRMLERYDALLGAREMKLKKDPNLLLPTSLANMHRQLERPSADEGFVSIETIAFARAYGAGRAGAAVPLDNLAVIDGIAPEIPVLVFGWTADEAAAREKVAAVAGARAEVLLCPHPDGPPTCWCRPPLPGLWLAFARKYGLDPRASTMFATSAAHRTMANELGLRVG
jgi:2,5-diketo-D-gluconate reductase B